MLILLDVARQLERQGGGGGGGLGSLVKTIKSKTTAAFRSLKDVIKPAQIAAVAAKSPTPAKSAIATTVRTNSLIQNTPTIAAVNGHLEGVGKYLIMNPAYKTEIDAIRKGTIVDKTGSKILDVDVLKINNLYVLPIPFERVAKFTVKGIAHYIVRKESLNPKEKMTDFQQVGTLFQKPQPLPLPKPKTNNQKPLPLPKTKPKTT